MLWGGNKNFIYIINKLKQTFHIGAEQGQAFNYIGIHLKLNDDFSTTINQIDYINSIHEIKVSDILKRSKNDKLIEKEITSLRGALGKINWVAGCRDQRLATMFAISAPESKMQQSQIYLPSTKSSNLLSQHPATSPFQ